MKNERQLITLLKRLMDLGARQPPTARIGLSPTQVNIIDQIQEKGELSVNKLSAILDLSPPTVSVAVRKMEEKGFIVKSTDSFDGRVTNLELTEKAKNLYRKIEEYRLNKVRKLLSNLEPEEQKVFLLLLGKAVKQP